MTDFDIRAFRPGDGAALADLHRRAVLAIPDRFYSAAEKQSWAFGLHPDLYAPAGGSVMEVVTAGAGRPIAFCHHRNDEIMGLYVDPDWQGRGVGTRLLARAEQAISARGHRTARITATVSALPFYQSQGYTIVEKARHRTRGGMLLDSVLLEKIIVEHR